MENVKLDLWVEKKKNYYLDKKIDLTKIDKSTYKTNTWLNKLEQKPWDLNEIIHYKPHPLQFDQQHLKFQLKYYSSHLHECAKIY